MTEQIAKDFEIRTDPQCAHCSGKGAVQVVRHGSIEFDPCRCALVVPLTEAARKQWFGATPMSIGYSTNC